MNTKIEFIKNIPNELGLKKNLHHIIVVDPASEKYPFETLLKSKLKRVGKKLTDLSKTPVSTELDNGAIISWIGYSSDLSTFKINTLIRKGFNILSQEKPTEISISFLPKNINESWVNACVYVSLVNSQALPNLKKGAKNVVLKKIILAGINKFDLSKTLALVKGNTLTRNLTITPPNNLTPTIYKAKIKQLAKLHKWVYKDYSMV